MTSQYIYLFLFWFGIFGIGQISFGAIPPIQSKGFQGTVKQSISASPILLTFSLSQRSVRYNGRVTLRWRSKNARSCEASGGWSGKKPLRGSERIPRLTSSQVYVLRCVGKSGAVSRDLPVYVQEPPPVEPPRAATSTSRTGVFINPPTYQTGTAPYTKATSGVFLNPPPFQAPSELATVGELAEFHGWALTHSIELAGVSKKVNDMYYHGYDASTDSADIKDVPGIIKAFRALQKLPDSVLEVMRGKTIYLSTVRERPYTILAGNYANTLKGLHDGFILTQYISAWNTVHELGHILSGHGILGLYNYNYPRFKILRADFDSIFDTGSIVYPPPKLPEGYMSLYATANQGENFSEHFAAYVLDAKEFRSRAAREPLLKEKYNFFKDHIFDGKEYE